ncbi:MAG: DUF1801 domain-containing protein [bacterium]
MKTDHPNKSLKTIDEYVAQQVESVREKLEKLRQTIKKVAPNAEEVISYQMPAYKYNGILVYFGVFKNHIGFFPTSSGIEAFRHELTEYKCSKGTIQFSLDKPLPLDLIKKIVKFRVMENEEKLMMKKNKL